MMSIPSHAAIIQSGTRNATHQTSPEQMRAHSTTRNVNIEAVCGGLLETITQDLLLDITMAMPPMTVETFTKQREARNGADWQWEWWFEGRQWFGQATGLGTSPGPALEAPL